MKPLAYNGPREVSVKEMPDPRIDRPTDVLVKITSTNICGSDLQRYEGRTDLEPGSVLGHENLGEVVEVIEIGDAVDRVQVGDWESDQPMSINRNPRNTAGAGRCAAVGSRRLSLLILLTVAWALPTFAQSMPDDLRSFLQQYVRLNDSEIGDAANGKVIAKVLPSSNQEVAVFGISRIRARPDFFVEKFRDIETYKKSTNVPTVKKFSNPAILEDLKEFELDQKDLNSLKDCRVGNCGVKLPSAIIERVQKEINWASPNAARQANQFAREALLQYVKEYLAGGNAALSEYNDKEQPLRLAEEFDHILQASPYVYDKTPEFYEYLRQYPRQPLEGVENFIYWSKEKFGLKPVISVTHVSNYRQPQIGRTVIASKQIYGSHYFEASLGLTGLVEAVPSSTAQPAFYLLYVNRSRADALRGGFGGLARGSVKRHARDGMLENMAKMQQSIDQSYRASR